MPTKNVVRIVPPSVAVVTASSATGLGPSPSSAAGSGGKVDAETASKSLAISGVRAGGHNGAAVHTTKDTSISQIGYDIKKEREVHKSSDDNQVTSTTGERNPVRREDFASVLDYLEAKYVKSIGWRRS